MWLAAHRAAGVAVVLALGIMLGAAPASAATGVGVVEVSDDGIHFSRTYPGAIFNDIAKLVPGDTQSDTIFVRNTGTTAGYLRITLRDARYSDQIFADALEVTTNVDGGAGVPTAVGSAKPCAVTSEGVLLAAGQTVPVIAAVALGDLDNTDGQGATASLSLRFTLSDVLPGTTPPTSCDATGATVVVTPTGPGSPTAPEPGAAVPDADSSTTPGTDPTGSRGESADFFAVPLTRPLSETASGDEGSTGLLPTLPASFTVDPNTWRLYQEYLVLILVLAAIIGAGVSWIAGQRSRKDTDDV